tara:strand:+ start:2432 stop:3811 length:1380 start_codon:yes stop_codon:yes gene_type:complete
MTSRFIQLRPDNVNSNAVISFKEGFPVLSFTIQSQNAILDPRSIRINGNLQVYKDNESPQPTPVYGADANRITMDNRLGIYAMWDQLVVRHNKTKQVVEHIRHYNRYMNSYLGLTSSKQDLLGHMSNACLMGPNSHFMSQNIVATTAAQPDAAKRPFSCHLPCGFSMSGNSINLMESSLGGFQIELHLSPDSNCLFSHTGTVAAANSDAHYRLSDLSLSCEVHDIPASEQAQMASQTSGAMDFNTISTIYTSFNTSNAQLQYSLGLKNLQSCFMSFVPSNAINTLQHNGLATYYPAGADPAGENVGFTNVQFLRGGQKYPVDFDMVTNLNDPQNDNVAGVNGGSFNVSDGQLAKQFAEAIIPEYMLDRSSIKPQNLNRNFSFNANGGQVGSYKQIPDGGGLFGIGMRYSQFNKGQDFSTEQWGVALTNELLADRPQSVFIYFKNKSTLVWSPTGVQVIQ